MEDDADVDPQCLGHQSCDSAAEMDRSLKSKWVPKKKEVDPKGTEEDQQKKAAAASNKNGVASSSEAVTSSSNDKGEKRRTNHQSPKNNRRLLHHRGRKRRKRKPLKVPRPLALSPRKRRPPRPPWHPEFSIPEVPRRVVAMGIEVGGVIFAA